MTTAAVLLLLQLMLLDATGRLMAWLTHIHCGPPVLSSVSMVA